MEEHDEKGISKQINEVSLLHSEENKPIILDKEKIDKQYVYRFFTRIIDIVGSSIGLILSSPLF